MLTPAAVSAVLPVLSGGDTNTLVPLFAIGVFVGFTLAQAGMVVHWCREARRPMAREDRPSTAPAPCSPACPPSSSPRPGSRTAPGSS
ncbi:hypothetical protein [Streptomyces parvulus]|uniref:hypothetical protein n=1 Tax=Streptomyces parvulus TaxID=146923 RepID=UPI003F4DF0E5